MYWNFYPYNNGKRVCIGWYSPWGCVGGYSTFGNHVGDWEHLTVRFIDGRPALVYLSQHADGQGATNRPVTA
nr:Vps62-related protein [Corallococcus exercitus]